MLPLLLLLLVSSEPAVTGVAAIRVDVADLEASVAFYCRHLGFELRSGERPDGSVVLDNHGVPLILRRVSGANPFADGAGDADRVQLNLYVEDLDAASARLRAAGVELAEGEHQSAVGRSRRLRDPSGNPLVLKELFHEGVEAETPRVYNVGLRVADVPRAEELYAGVLGFGVYSRDYYPPVLPLRQRGATSFILSDGEGGGPPPGEPGRDARVMLRFTTDDLTRSIGVLLEHGVELVDEEPREVPEGHLVALRDPFGHVHELLEPAAAPRPPAPSPEEALASLAWMHGTWTATDAGGGRLEETWSLPVGDSLVGSFRWQRASGETWLYELITIEREGDEIVFRLHHFARHMELWPAEREGGPLTYPLASVGPNEVVFEDPAARHPRRFVYRRIGDELHALIEGEGPANRIVFRAARP